MIISIEELLTINELKNIQAERLSLMESGIEDFIRNYTNNNFINKNITFNTPSSNGKLETVSPPFKVGDTIQISNSKYNDGLYVLNSIDGTLDKELFDCEYNKINLVQYPQALKMGVIRMLVYNAKMDGKIGISSETLSRHSVTYEKSSNDSVGGYPSYLTSFLKPYMKARF